jgi:hypothetical protein
MPVGMRAVVCVNGNGFDPVNSVLQFKQFAEMNCDFEGKHWVCGRVSQVEEK